MSSHAHAAGGMGDSGGKGWSVSVRPGLVSSRRGVGWTGVLGVGGGGERSRGAGRRGEVSSSEEGTGMGRAADGGGGCKGIGALEGGPEAAERGGLARYASERASNSLAHCGPP